MRVKRRVGTIGHVSPLIMWQAYDHVIKGSQTDAEDAAAPLFEAKTA